jgi:ADP-heptose:LPS heptosyltransferase
VESPTLPGNDDRDSDNGVGGDARSPAASGERVERIVIYRVGSLGDTVVALPCFHKLAEAFPSAERYVLTNIPVSSKAAALELILGQSGLIQGVIDYPLKLRSVKEMWSLSRRLRAIGATTLIYLAPTKRNVARVLRDLLFFWLAGFSRIIGAPVDRDLRDARVDPATGFEEYECARLARTLAALGPIDLDDPKNWDLVLTDAEKKAGDQALDAFDGNPFIAINMGGKFVENHWGESNWRELLRTLSATHGGYGLFFLGAADESRAVAEVADAWPGTVVNACGTLLPRESAGALRRASLFIGHDSGPMHLAAAVGITCVAPFSNLNRPRRWHPYGAKHRIIHRMEGIQNIRVEEIASNVRDVLPALPMAPRSDVCA